MTESKDEKKVVEIFCSDEKIRSGARSKNPFSPSLFLSLLKVSKVHIS